MIDYTISVSNCYLKVDDTTNKIVNDYALSGIRIMYNKNTFEVTDTIKTFSIAIANLSKINAGAFATFNDLYNFIESARSVCGGGGGGGSQNLQQVLTVGNDGGALEIVNILDPTTAQSATTKNYVDTEINTKVTKNTAIPADTKTKVTYDAKGLVTSATDATTADIADSTNKRYVTDAEQVVIGNTSGTNSGDETTSTLGATINGASAATPNDTDLVATVDTSVVKKITWTNVKAFLKTYFDTLYQNLSLSAYTFRANNTNATANATDHTFMDIAQQTYTGSITWTGTTAPSGATDHSYRWSQVGKLVTLRLTLIYASAGTALTSVVCSLPTDCPTPEGISGSTANGSALYVGCGTLSTGIVGDGMSPSVVGGMSELKINSGGSGYDIKIHRPSAGYRTARAVIQYYAT